MRSRMTDKQRAELLAASELANSLNEMAIAANGHGVTRIEREKAQKALQKAVGKKNAAKLQESALQRAGAAPKGWRRFIG